MSESLGCCFPLGISWCEITPETSACQAPYPKILCASLKRPPTPRRGKSSSYNLHRSSQPPHSLFTGFPQQELPSVESFVETSSIPAALFALYLRGTVFTLCLRENGSMDRISTTRAAVPRVPPAVANPGSLKALLLELEASLQGTDQGTGPRAHRYMPQAHRLRPSTHRLWLPGYRAHGGQISRALLTP